MSAGATGGTGEPVAGMTARAQAAPVPASTVPDGAAGVVPDEARTSARRTDWLVDQLPAGMLAEDFFVRFVRIFQAQAETLLAHADTLPHLADPRLAPPEMVRYLAQWLGAPGIDAAEDESAERAALLGVAATLPWRGTRRGLEPLLEVYSGAPARVEDGGGVWADGEAPQDTAWVRIVVESTGSLGPDDFLALVLDELPAHVRAEIVVGGARLWPPTAANEEAWSP